MTSPSIPVDELVGIPGLDWATAERLLRGETVGTEPVPDYKFDCIYRGGFLETGECNLCGLKGQPFEIYACQLFARCSITRKHSQIQSCGACEKRTAVATNDPAAVS